MKKIFIEEVWEAIKEKLKFAKIDGVITCTPNRP
jgi:hypothetical protein